MQLVAAKCIEEMDGAKQQEDRGAGSDQ